MKGHSQPYLEMVLIELGTTCMPVVRDEGNSSPKYLEGSHSVSFEGIRYTTFLNKQ